MAPPDAFPEYTKQCLDGRVVCETMFPVAHGDCADVFKGRFVTMQVAIKVPRQSGDREEKLFRRLWREYLTWSRLSYHPNILACVGYSYDLSPDFPSLISPWMENGNVTSYLLRFPDADRRNLLLGIGNGLYYLHTRDPGIVHGNVRASNILVSERGIPCLAGFSLSHVSEEINGRTTSIVTPSAVRWMSPERFDPEDWTTDGVTVKSDDVWAYGMTMLEVLSGEFPYSIEENPRLVLEMIITGEIPSRPQSQHLDDHMWSICQRCWSYDPSARPLIKEVISMVSHALHPKQTNDADSSPVSTPSYSPTTRDTFPRKLQSSDNQYASTLTDTFGLDNDISPIDPHFPPESDPEDKYTARESLSFTPHYKRQGVLLELLSFPPTNDYVISSPSTTSDAYSHRARSPDDQHMEVSSPTGHTFGPPILPEDYASDTTSDAVSITGRTVRFTNQDIGLFEPKKLSHRRNSDLNRVPNLTGRIKIMKGPLRAGGFCDIFKGEFTNEMSTEPIAMKMLRLFNTEEHVVKAKKKFRQEVSLWCSLRHSHVLPFYGTCELDEFRLFMVSPWAEGGNSLEYLKRNPLADRGRLLWQTASALEYLHSGIDAPPVVHGDLKADNVLMSVMGDALLCDFGMSVYVEEIISKSGSSSAGHAGGHPRFMAPELIYPEDGSKSSRPTRESDIFAFASLMLQIYTEEVPFADLREVQAIINIASGKLPLRPTDPLIVLRGCDDGAWNLMTDCWRFKPSERPAMEEVTIRMKK